jgi:putative ABC transport system permease protein
MPWGQVDIWTPLVLDKERGYRYPFLLLRARLSRDKSIEESLAELVASYQAIEYQDSLPAADRSLNIIAFPEIGVQNIRDVLYLLWTASGLVLLIACANVAHLLLARSARREAEMAMRVVMGAGRLRLMRLSLMESSFLAVAGSVLGLGLAFVALALVRSFGPTNVPRLTDVDLDGRMVLFALVTAALTNLVFGCVPALRASRPHLGRMLQGVGRGSSEGRRGSRVRAVLVMSEVALCLLLLISASLVIESFFRLQQVDSGYEPENVLALRLELPTSRYPERPQRDQVVRELLARYASVPGVVSVGAVNSLPLSNVHFSKLYRLREAKESDEATHRAALCFTSPRYLQTMGVRLLRGRFLEEEDMTHPARVVVINQTLARERWGRGDPIGERLWLDGEEGPPPEIVGVVADVRRRQVNREAEPAMYIPRLPSPSVSFVVRATADPMVSIRALKHETARVDGRLPVYGIATLEERIQRATSESRFQSMLMLAFSGVALTLAIVGVYGVMSYVVVSRRHEIGIRKAMGARRGDVMLMVLRQAGLMSLVGVVLGMVAAYLLTGFLDSMLFGVSSRDARVFVFAPAVILLVGIVASWLPARRAASVDPNQALRST